MSNSGLILDLNGKTLDNNRIGHKGKGDVVMRGFLSSFWVILFTHIIFGCSSDSGKEEERSSPLHFRELAWVNRLNQGNYEFGGSCTGSGTLSYDLVEVTEEENPEKWSGRISCANEKWNEVVNLDNFQDGDISLVVSFENYTSPLMMFKKDTVIPTFSFPTVDSVFRKKFKLAGECSEDGGVAVTLTGKEDVLAGEVCRNNQWEVAIDFADQPDNQYEFSVHFKDLAGNPANQRDFTITKDSTPPILTLDNQDQLPAINNNNNDSYNIAGDCENNGPLVVTIGEHPLSTQPTCSNGRWTAQLPLDLELGEVIITVNHSDPLGNQAPAIVARTTKDTVAPTLTSTVSLSPESGQHDSGVPLSFTVNFNEDVVVTNTPRLHLDFTSGETTTLKYATYSSSSGSEVIFIYNVVPGDHADSIALGHGSLIDLNGGSITDRAGNPAKLSTTLTVDLTGVSINATMPILKLVSAPADSFVKNGDSVVLTATFSTPVSVTGSPLLQLRVGRLITEYATFSGSVNSASAAHEFSYRPIAGDGTVQVTGVTDGTIQDDSDRNLAAVHQAISVSGLVVDNTAPAITGVDDDSQVATSKTWSWGCDDEKGCTYRHVVDNAATTELAGDFNDVITATVDTGTTRYYLHVQATDKAGNKSPVRHVYADVDNSVATISSTRPPAEKTYSLGEALDFVVEFSEDVTVVGGPRIILALQSGGTTYADYHSGSGSRELVFRYQVAEGDLDENGIELANSNMIDLNNGRIVGGADQDAQLSALSFSGLPRIRVNGIKLTLTVSGTQGRYKAGDTIPLLITFSEEVIITGGIPEIRLEIGAGNTVRKDILTGSGNTRGVQYQVQAGENDEDGIRVLGLHLPPGVEIKDGNGNELDLANYEAETLSQVMVDTASPTINYPSKVGDTWYWSCRDASPPCTYRFTFNQATSPAFSETDAFSATSSAEQPDSLVDGDYYYLHIEAKDVVGNTGVLSHSFRFEIQDDTPPIASRVTVEDGSYKDSILISVDFGELVLLSGGTSQGIPRLKLQVGAHSKLAHYDHGKSTGTKIVFRYRIHSGDTDENGVALVSGSIIDNLVGDIKDYNGNTYDNTVPLPTLSGVAKVDTTNPALVSASSSGNYKAGDKAIIAVTFNEAVSLAGSPQLEVRSSDGETARITAVGEEHLSRTHDFTYLVADGQDGSVEIIRAVSGSPKIRDAARNAVIQNSFFDTAISVTGLTVDTTPPALPTPTKSETTWSWSCTDALTSCTSYFIFNQRPSHFFTPEEGLTPSTSATQPNDLLPGTNYIHVQAQDEAGNVALNSVQFQVAGTDSTSPTVNRVRVLDGNYSIGDEVKIIVEFNETVSLFRNSATDTPTIQLQVGSTAKTANYTETSGGDMIFVYTVASGDADEDGPGLSSGATIVLPADASIKDSSSNLFGNSAALPAISLGVGRIDGIRPTLASAAGSGSYRKDQSVTFTLTFNEEVLVTGGNIQLKLRYSDGEEITVDSEGEQRPSQTHDFSYQVQNGQNGTIEIIELGVSFSGKIEDGVGNALTTGILAQAVSILGVSVDTTTPVVTINTPVAATSSNQANYPLGGSCEGNAPLTVRIIEGQDPPARTASCQNGSWSGHFDLSALPDNASYGVMAEQTDAAGNSSERVWEDIVKGTPPVYTRIMPLPGISGGTKHTCALDSGQVKCWGTGRLGNGGISSSHGPVRVRTDEAGHPPLDNIVAISIETSYSIALKSNGELWGWGANGTGYLKPDYQHLPYAARLRNIHGQVLDNKSIQISTGDSNICTLRSNGEVSCWGYHFPQDPDRQDIRGQIIKDRYGREIDKFIQVISGYKHFCGLFYTGQVWCWGADGSQGQLGNGLSFSQYYAAPVHTSFADSTPLGNVVLIRVKGNHTCALLADSTVKCWGQGDKGQLGDGVEENSLHDHGHLYPVTVRDSENAGGSSLENLVDLDTGRTHNCALDSSGGAFCWGNQYHGRLGNGQSSSIRSYPDSVTVLKGDTVANFSRISQIGLGEYHSCARTWRGHIYCWGSDTYGQLGNEGSSPNQTRATLVTKSGGTPETFGAGEFQHSYICQNANCTLQDISLSLGESRETFNNDDSPTINVAGIDTGETVDLYSDSDCATQVGVEAIETNPSVSLTGLNDGVHRFYFTVESEGNTSACSQRPLIYTLDTVVPEVTLTRTNGVWNWSCNNADENCIYRHVINTNASHTFGSADSYGVAITATATAEGQYIHLQSRDGAGNESTVATNGPVPADEVPDL